MKGVVCSVCGFIAIDGVAPEKCPVCAAPKTSFAEKDDAIVTPSDASDKVEANKKHIPSIKVVKQCGLIPDGCTDVHIKVGETTHPMQPEHFITYVDSYLDKKFISRTYFSPTVLNPATCLHLKAPSGKVSVIERCSIHGAWISEVDL